MWSAIEVIAPKIGSTSQTLLNWVRHHERDTGQREGKGLWRANEILKLASVFFVQAEFVGRMNG